MVQEDGVRWVGMLPDVHKDFLALTGTEERWRKKLQQHFRNFGLPGTTLPAEHFASEGRHPTGGPKSKDLQLSAFKAYQHRLYGTMFDLEGHQTFVGLQLITDKKKNKADQQLLKRIAQGCQRFIR
jgi:hypothetical protein